MEFRMKRRQKYTQKALTILGKENYIVAYAFEDVQHY
jgi:hypothetical protein